MRKFYLLPCFFFTFLFLPIATDFYSQQYRWYTLPNAPFDEARFEDIFFINPNTGWIIRSTTVNGTKQPNLYKTTDGGHSWLELSDTITLKGTRCIDFVNENTGWIGSISFQGGRVFKTTNGGLNWVDQFANITVDTSYSICGLSAVDENFVFGCGRWFGPATFYKTTNGGGNWIITDMSQYAARLIDIKFFNRDSGFVTGGIGLSDSSKGIILFTSNGGATWVTRFVGQANRQFGWKIDFPSKDTGYVSLQRTLSGSSYFVKTTDGGNTWMENLFLPGTFFSQGIGFLNGTTGWNGGWFFSTYMTTNGGQNWFPNPWGYNVNRIRFLSDTLAYAVGQTVYKYDRDTSIGINLISTRIPERPELIQNYPNPFNPTTKIRFSVVDYENAILSVFDVLGREIKILVNKRFNPGVYEYTFDATGMKSGVYFYKIETFHYTETKKMILLK